MECALLEGSHDGYKERREMKKKRERKGEEKEEEDRGEGKEVNYTFCQSGKYSTRRCK